MKRLFVAAGVTAALAFVPASGIASHHSIVGMSNGVPVVHADGGTTEQNDVNDTADDTTSVDTESNVNETSGTNNQEGTNEAVEVQQESLDSQGDD